ncbi:AAA family ATPase [Flavobacterium sp. 25HG05S-40]|uniref:AAA family ATPase n=1 Tax=Flavobacterium sp. 25HG05S-40 TaxID=3458682 RepID=UPI0040445478
MKKVITIKSLTLENFKGQKRLHIDFENQTDIYGANGTGKTTIADAVNWLWFGKDSQDRKDFEIKTLDANGKTNPKTEVEVSAVYLIDGDTVTMKRVLKENWVKKRGSSELEYTGNTTECYWNEVPMLVSDFNKKVNAVLEEQVFKMITSATYFNSIDWKLKRNILTQIAGEVSDSEIAAGNPSYEALLLNLTQGKTLDEYKKQIADSVKKAKEDLKAIPTRIDEVNRQKPEALDFDALEKDLATNQKDLEKVDSEIQDSSKAFQSKLDSQRDLKISINNVESEITNIETNSRKEALDRLTPDTSALNKLTNDLRTKEGEVSSLTNTNTTLEQKKSNLEANIKATSDKMDAKRAEWGTENAKELVFDDSNFCCPTCERAYDPTDIEGKKAQMLTKFKADKNAKLNEITAEGQRLKAYKETLESELKPIPGLIQENENSITEAKTKIESIKAEISSLNNVSASDLPSEEDVYQSILSLHPTYENKKKELETLRGQLVDIPQVNNEELQLKRKELVEAIDNIKGQLNLKTQIESCNKRIDELKKEELTLSQQIVDVEKIQFTIENFIKAKIDRLESSINGKFKMVTFKMFEEQINGALRETCVAMVNGVPFTDLNTASRINAGLDIINTLSDFYGVSAPVIIDNRESVTDLIETDNQIISLIVSPMHKKLTVESKEMVA